MQTGKFLIIFIYYVIKIDIYLIFFKIYKLTNETHKMSNQSSENMKKLLKYCKDISQYYRLITQLDFTDCIDELKTKNYISIVNDLILNKKMQTKASYIYKSLL